MLVLFTLRNVAVLKNNKACIQQPYCRFFVADGAGIIV